MIKHILLLWLLCIPLILQATQTKGFLPIKTQQGQQVGQYNGSYALLIGVSDYRGGWSDLESIPGELDEVESALKEQGFEVTRVMNPNGEQLKKAYQDFINRHSLGRKQRDNRLLFFFSGHGYSEPGDDMGYLVPTDAATPDKDEAGFYSKALSMSRIMTMAREMRNKHALFLFDSCFSGTIFKAKSYGKVPPHIADFTAKPVRMFISAGSAGEEVPAKSDFTPEFVRAIKYRFADYNQDNYVTGMELGMYLHEKVLAYNKGQTPQYGKIKDSDLNLGDFVFALNRSSVTTTTLPLRLPGDSSAFSLEDLETRATQLEQAKAAWAAKQSQMQSAYDQLQAFEDRSIPPADKATAWNRFLTAFNENNPHSQKDESLRQQGQQRLSHWQEQDREEKQRKSKEEQERKLKEELARKQREQAAKQSASVSRPSSSSETRVDNYILHGDGTVTHQKTGLMWQQGEDEKRYDWKDAKQHCSNLTLAGYSDWRLPDRDELRSLLEKKNTDGLYINQRVFRNARGDDWYWSSTVNANSPRYAWYVRFDHGFYIDGSSDRSDRSGSSFYARCVRGGR